MLNISAVAGNIGFALASLEPAYDCTEDQLKSIAFGAVSKQVRMESDGRRPPGIRIPISAESLFSEVVVGPREPAWVVDLVRNVTARYAEALPVRQSGLAFSRV